MKNFTVAVYMKYNYCKYFWGCFWGVFDNIFWGIFKIYNFNGVFLKIHTTIHRHHPPLPPPPSSFSFFLLPLLFLLPLPLPSPLLPPPLPIPATPTPSFLPLPQIWLRLDLVCIDIDMLLSSDDDSKEACFLVELPDKETTAKPTTTSEKGWGYIGISSGCFYYSNRHCISSESESMLAISLWTLVVKGRRSCAGSGYSFERILMHKMKLDNILMPNLEDILAPWKKLKSATLVSWTFAFHPSNDRIYMAARDLVVQITARSGGRERKGGEGVAGMRRGGGRRREGRGRGRRKRRKEEEKGGGMRKRRKEGGGQQQQWHWVVAVAEKGG